MPEYEVFMLKSGVAGPVLLKANHISDDEAVLWARKHAKGRAFQIWRGMDCIHDERAQDKPGSQHAA